MEYREHPNADAEIVIAATEADAVDESHPSDLTDDAQPSRSERILSLITEMASDGVVDRQSSLTAARDRKLVEGKTPASTAEQFRKVLIELKNARLIDFDNKTISLGLGATPNRPNGPP